MRPRASTGHVGEEEDTACEERKGIIVEKKREGTRRRIIDVPQDVTLSIFFFFFWNYTYIWALFLFYVVELSAIMEDVGEEIGSFLNRKKFAPKWAERLPMLTTDCGQQRVTKLYTRIRRFLFANSSAWYHWIQNYWEVINLFCLFSFTILEQKILDVRGKRLKEQMQKYIVPFNWYKPESLSIIVRESVIIDCTFQSNLNVANANQYTRNGHWNVQITAN